MRVIFHGTLKLGEVAQIANGARLTENPASNAQIKKLHRPAHSLPLIPKILHQTYRPSRPLAERLEQCIAQNRAINPDWDYRYYSNEEAEDFLFSHFGHQIVDLFRRIDPSYGAAKADLLRYACVYEIGGVYLDIKSICTRPLSSVLSETDECVLSHWNSILYPGWGVVHPELTSLGIEEFQQWFLIAQPKHPFIENALNSAVRNLENYRFRRDGVGPNVVLRATGPIAFTLAVIPLLSSYVHRVVDAIDDLGLIYDAFDSVDSRMQYVQRSYRESVQPLLIPRLIPSQMHSVYSLISEPTLRSAAKLRSIAHAIKDATRRI